MKRAKGTVMLDGSFVRYLDAWREAAGLPLPALRITSERAGPADHLVWTLDADGQRVSQWRELDAPGLGAWLEVTLYQFHGAWHLARDELRDVKHLANAALLSARARSGPDSKAAAVRKEIERLAAAGRDPAPEVTRIARKANCTEQYVRRILRATEFRN